MVNLNHYETINEKCFEDWMEYISNRANITINKYKILKMKMEGKYMNKIKIKRNSNGDTRTAPKGVSFEEFNHANCLHRIDVANTMHWISQNIENKGLSHDWSKTELGREFYKDFKNTLENGIDFTQGEWWDFHINRERHHLLARCPDDVNLIDVIEMICDCVCRGIARSGEVRELEISDDILRRAVDNTVKLLVNNIEMRD